MVFENASRAVEVRSRVLSTTAGKYVRIIPGVCSGEELCGLSESIRSHDIENSFVSCGEVLTPESV